MLTKHFSLKEVTNSQTATEKQIDNTLPDIYFNNALDLAVNILEPIREHFRIPFSPTSWYRSQELNEILGGIYNSEHLLARAADITLRKIENSYLAEYIKNNLEYNQLILEPNWVHVSYRKGANKMEVLTMKKVNNEKIYMQGLIY